MHIKYKVVTYDYKSVAVLSTDAAYRITYTDTGVITAPRGTLGIFCFNSIHDVRMWTKSCNYWTVHIPKLLRVLPIGPGRTPKYIADIFMNVSLSTFYDKNYEHSFFGPPEGTICYPAVIVLDEIPLT